MKDKISIIIPTFNAEKTLENTLLSVIEQTYENFEIIIIDGLSTDKTNDIIEKYKNSISVYVSEKDKGIYDAMNKGSKKATGDWLFFLGADDNFYDNSVLKNIFNSKIEKAFMMVYGNILYTNNKVFTSTNNWKNLFYNSVYHQSAFYRKKLFDKYNYNIDNRIASDYDLTLYIYTNNFKTKYYNLTITLCGHDGLSKQGLFVGYEETMNIRKEYLHPAIAFFSNTQTYLRYIIKKVLLVNKK